MELNKGKTNLSRWTWLLLLLAIASIYVFTYLTLDRGLKSIYDEGFFFLGFKGESVFTVFTRPLSMGNVLLKSLFPGIGEWDILQLRQFSFLMKITGLLLLIVSSAFFFYREQIIRRGASIFPLVTCLLLFGILIIPSVVVNHDDELLFFEMFLLSLSLFSVEQNNKWARGILIVLIGFFSLWAIICNAPGGIMLLVLNSLFVFLFRYDGRTKVSFWALLSLLLLGIALSLSVIHLFMFNLHDCVVFLRDAVNQTTSGGAASHHSMRKIMLVILLGIKDFLLSMTVLCGITYLCKDAYRMTRSKWAVMVAGSVLFFLALKWQSPRLELVSILLSGLFILLVEGRFLELMNRDMTVFVLFLFLLPLAVSFGTNVSYLKKVAVFIVPWGILVYYWGLLATQRLQSISAGWFFVIFVLCLGYAYSDFGNRHIFSQTINYPSPISRMKLSQNQKQFYSEVKDVLDDYHYCPQKDTLLGFCFNEMTIVALDAIPYTNDQQPEEFLTHKTQNLAKPSFLILTDWDFEVIQSFIESLDWGFPEEYDIIPLKTNPNPESEFSLTHSTLYCLKARKHTFENAHQAISSL